MQVIKIPDKPVDDGVDSWVNQSKSSGWSGTLQTRYENYGKVIRVRWDVNKGGAVFSSGTFGTINTSAMRPNQDSAFLGATKGGQGGEYGRMVIRTNGSCIMISTGGGSTQDFRGECTYAL